MPPTISASVGNKATNFPDDVRTVQTLLNGFVAAGRMGDLSPLKIDGNPKPTIPYIETFQKKLAGFFDPDGKISPNGLTWAKLNQTPDGVVELIAGFNMVDAARKRTPPGKMPDDLWQAGLNALVDHLGNVHLHNPEIVTFMDFRIIRTERRLWTVNIRDGELVRKTYVAHGKNSGGEKAKKFDNRDYKTSLGAYVTLSMGTSSKLGMVNGPEPTASVIGLEKGTNDRAYHRGIKFHAATYVNAPSPANPYSVGNSDGCFATPVHENKTLIPEIAGGTFAYAYAG
jgi:hypothetical protein